MSTSVNETTVVFRKRDLRGSRLRFLTLTSMPREQVAETLTRLASPWASVGPNDHWIPNGFREPEEAKLGECPQLLPAGLPTQLTDWWLKVPERANTPNWDLVSTCNVGGEPGLMLIEGKAHSGECKKDGKPAGNAENDKQIKGAIDKANLSLDAVVPGWHLSRDSCYQLSNRFAWAWKVSSLGVPTILVYLGFLHAAEMRDQGRPFDSGDEWKGCIHDHASDVVPSGAWECRLQATGAPMWTLIRSLDFKWATEADAHRMDR